MIPAAQKLVARLPHRLQQELRRHAYHVFPAKLDIGADERAVIDAHTPRGACVLDIGAGVGNYTMYLSRRVGPQGRVIAFEPTPAHFELLTANVARLEHRNVSLFNAALSARTGFASMRVPSNEVGAKNYYRASVAEDGGDFDVLCLSLKSFELPRPIAFVKLVAEGHELSILDGMKDLLERDRPVLMLLHYPADVVSWLTAAGYRPVEIRSKKRLFVPTPLPGPGLHQTA